MKAISEFPARRSHTPKPGGTGVALGGLALANTIVR